MSSGGWSRVYKGGIKATAVWGDFNAHVKYDADRKKNEFYVKHFFASERKKSEWKRKFILERKWKFYFQIFKNSFCIMIKIKNKK